MTLNIWRNCSRIAPQTPPPWPKKDLSMIPWYLFITDDPVLCWNRYRSDDSGWGNLIGPHPVPVSDPTYTISVKPSKKFPTNLQIPSLQVQFCAHSTSLYYSLTYSKMFWWKSMRKKVRSLIRIYIKVKSWIRTQTRIRLNLQMTSQKVWNLSLF